MDVLIWLLRQLFKWLRERREKKEQLQLEAAEAEQWAVDQEQERLELVDALAEHERVAVKLRDGLRRDRASQKLIPTLNDYVLPRVRSALREVLPEGAAVLDEHAEIANEADVVLPQLHVFVAQRRDATLRHPLGDADALAMACYRPVFDFARANRVPLSSALPVTMLSPFDLSVWTGFAHTGIAPIFLPPDFFERLVWWPALAHEIGHDFLVATGPVEDRLRRQLELPSEEAGLRPLALWGDALSAADLYRVFGGWFEEIFCDLFGTLMIGPAYVFTMTEVFATGDAESVTTVPTTHWGYAVHPPAHLRVMLGVRALELVGEHEEAERLAADWNRRHDHPDSFSYPTTEGGITVPAEPVLKMAYSIIETLYGDEMVGLDGHTLADIPGVDFGPRAAAKADQARRLLEAGQAPHGLGARAIIGGAVMAWRANRGAESSLLRLARAAIKGETEWVEDDPALAAANQQGAGDDDALSARDAFVLHTLLAPPVSMRQRRGGGLLSPAFARRR